MSAYSDVASLHIGPVFGMAKVKYNNQQFGTMKVASSVSAVQASSIATPSIINPLFHGNVAEYAPLTPKERIHRWHAIGKAATQNHRKERERNQAKWNKVRGLFGKPKPKVKGYSPVNGLPQM